MHDLEKRIIHSMQHIGIWYILVVFFPLESCLENTSFSKTSAIEPKQKLELHATLLPGKVDNTGLTSPVDEKTIKTGQEREPGSHELKLWDTLVPSNSSKVKSKVFKIAGSSCFVKFYQKDGLWRANVNDSLTKKEYDLVAHINQEDIKLLASSFKTNSIQVVPGNSYKEGYVYLGGLRGGMKKNKRNQENQEDNKKRKLDIDGTAGEIISSIPKIQELLNKLTNEQKGGKEEAEENIVRLELLEKLSKNTNILIDYLKPREITFDSNSKQEWSKVEINTKSEYNESQIVFVWDKYIMSQNLVYFIATGNGQNNSMQTDQDTAIQSMHLLNSLSAQEGKESNIRPLKEAGLLLNSSNKLHKNFANKSVTICTFVERNQNPSLSVSSNQDFNLITNALEVAVDQILFYNNLVEDKEKIKDHIIVFPYHITDNHWALGTLEINLDKGRFLGAVIRVYNPLPSCGGQMVSQEAIKNISALLNKKFSKTCVNFNFNKVKGFENLPKNWLEKEGILEKNNVLIKKNEKSVSICHCLGSDFKTWNLEETIKKVLTYNQIKNHTIYLVYANQVICKMDLNIDNQNINGATIQVMSSMEGFFSEVCSNIQKIIQQKNDNLIIFSSE